MKSMTGFGQAQATIGSVEIQINIKAVNGRFLEPRLHLPREYQVLEPALRKSLSQVFVRGTIDVMIHRKSLKSSAGVAAVNLDLAKEYQKGLLSLKKRLKLKGEPSLELIARLPDVVKMEDRQAVLDEELKLVEKIMQQALKACVKEREREGAALKRELLSLLEKLEQTRREMLGARELAQSEMDAKYRERLQKLMANSEVQVDPARVAQEVAILLDRSDIHEELVRLNEHIAAYRGLLNGSESQGKKLDFYAQELLREVNTIGSKSHVSRLTQLVVDGKALVERLREQVQNVE